MCTQIYTQFILCSLWISNHTSFYLCAFFIISSPPSRKDFISLGMEDSPAHKSTTLPPSLVSTPTLCLPPSTNWIRRIVCLNRLSIQLCIRSGRIPSKCRNIKQSNTIQSSSLVCHEKGRLVHVVMYDVTNCVLALRTVSKFEVLTRGSFWIGTGVLSAIQST